MSMRLSGLLGSSGVEGFTSVAVSPAAIVCRSNKTSMLYRSVNSVGNILNRAHASFTTAPNIVDAKNSIAIKAITTNVLSRI
eukprot:1029137-Ditylum_brightwellii.AAC.1